jgi:hypothetical protein
MLLKKSSKVVFDDYNSIDGPTDQGFVGTQRNTFACWFKLKDSV